MNRAGPAALASTRHLGLDLGVTNLKWSVVERAGSGWQSVAVGQVPTRSDDGPEAVVARMAKVAREVMDTHPGIGTMGVGVPGLYDPSTGVTEFLVNMPGGWRDIPVTVPLSDALGIPVSLVNDARAFGLAELRLGAGRGVSSMIGLTLGTGIGGFVAIDGRVLQGRRGTAGELGHQTIDPDGPWCNCGTRGCMEAFCRADQIALACGTATVEEAVRAARAGDDQANDGLAQTGRYLGIGIANAVIMLNPDRVVLGGGVAAAGDLIIAPIRAELARRVHVTAWEHIEVVTAALGPTAGALGAAIHGAEQGAPGARP